MLDFLYFCFMVALVLAVGGFLLNIAFLIIIAVLGVIGAGLIAIGTWFKSVWNAIKRKLGL